MRTFFVLVLVVALGNAGCETISDHQKTAIGAGAPGDALIGGLLSRNTTGVVVGGLLGGLAGGGIGYCLERQDRTATQAVADTGSTPAQGNPVRVHGVQANPAQIRPGQTVNLTTTYTVLTPQAGQSHAVRETREVRHDGALAPTQPRSSLV